MTTDALPSLRNHRLDNDFPRITPSRGPSPSPQPSRAPSIHMTEPPAQTPQNRKRRSKHPPQKTIDVFWARFTSKTPGKAYTILPDNFYAKRASAYASLSTTSSSLQTPAARFAPHLPNGQGFDEQAQNAVASYEEAREACIRKVEKIVKECYRLNQKYRDPHFDIESDFKRWLRFGNPPDCLMGLAETGTELKPMSVKRVEDIFENPRFFIEGATANDVRQGKEGDCWLMAALTTLSNKPGLIDRVCVARNERVGVYGFVFHRDGEWISEVIDDKLYLIKEDFDESLLERNKWLELQNRTSPEEEYRTVMQTGSRALYFAQCSDANETWLPLLEKAFAKAHGDFGALESGFVGEGIEDLTGGVTTELFASDILDKDKFWHEELMNVNKNFLFGCGQMGGRYGQRKGILEKHAYSIMEAREVNGERLLKLRNPWGNGEWTGAWADGSAEWTPEWMSLLDHKFGDDGVFWISYRDVLRHYQHFDRTRLFGPEWTVTQSWTSLNVPWSVDYLETKFKVTLAKASHCVFVLSQLDDRYFRGLEGQYEFHLQFRVHAEGEEDYIVRSNSTYYMRRGVNTELNLEAGNYFILMKISAKRYSNDPEPEEIVKRTCHNRREKLLSVGLSYDLAHAKGQFRQLDIAAAEKQKKDKRERIKDNAKKMHEGRRKQHKKLKLKNMKTDLRKQEKMRQKEEKELERQRREAEATQAAAAQSQSGADAASIEKGLEDFKFGQGKSQTEPNGLGIAVYGREAAAAVSGLPTPAATPGPSQLQHSILSNGEITGSPRPATPPMPQHHRSATDPRPTRKDTLSRVNPPSRRGTLSPLPMVRVQRPSVVAANANGKTLSLSDISDDDLSWDSDIDGPDETESDGQDDIGRGRSGFAGGAFGGLGGFGPGADGDEDGSDEDDQHDPWNAVCVVGLRVFCEDKEREAKVRVEVVRPGAVSGGMEPSRKGRSETIGQRRLDVDDSAADAARGLRRDMYGVYGLVEGELGSGPAHLEPSRQGA